MLTIREKQLKTLDEKRRDSFEPRALAYLKSEYQEQYEERGGEEMSNFLHRTIEKAAKYDIDLEDGILTCAELSIIYGEEFYEKEIWAAHILKSESSQLTKIVQLKEFIDKSKLNTEENSDD